MDDIKAFAKENFLPIVRNSSAMFLKDFCENHKPKTILEIGTCIGYSGLIMVKASGGELTTIEIDEKKINIAKQNFQKESLEAKFILGDAKDVILNLVGKFDLIFLDGPKAQYSRYLPTLLTLLNVGGYIIADNVLYFGLVESLEPIKHKHRTIVMRLREYLNMVFNDENLESELVRLEEGICLSKKINE